MGIYSKKRKKSGFRFIVYGFFLLFIILVLGYYFFYPSNPNTVLEKKPLEIINENKNEPELVNKINEADNSQEKIENDLTNYLEIGNLDNSIKDFIQNNPDFILDVLRKYQDEQNKIEQEKINQQNNSNITSLKLFDNPMVIGNVNASKIIFEFVDYNCGYCLKFHEQVLSLLNEDQNTKLVIMQMPILGESSISFSKMVIAASFQNKFEEVHNYLYSSNRKSKMADILGDLFLMNIDIVQLEQDMNSEKVSDVILSHEQFVNKFKLNGTPAIIIGDTIIPGYIEKNKIIEILENEFS
ncbi:thioredoxin domain-containing protein [Alphaproteobacteria bacterium]|nr:thioredoxin domain-containing protein [Alphaproteobacteria bacterium]